MHLVGFTIEYITMHGPMNVKSNTFIYGNNRKTKVFYDESKIGIYIMLQTPDIFIILTNISQLVSSH